MSIVAISQTLGSLGNEIGRELARTIGYEFADREIILQAAERFGEGVTELAHVTEERPTLAERFTQSRQRYLAYVEAIVFEMAARDNVVLSGRGVTFILNRVRHALRVRVTAPERVRAKRVEHQQGFTPEGAAHFVRDSDREHASRIRFLYHVDWDDPLLYDHVLNTEHLDVRAAARVIQEMLHTERCQPTSESLTAVKDLSLIAQAKAALAAHPMTRTLQLSLDCKSGHLTISGMVEREDRREVAEEIVRKVPGVTTVLSQIAVSPRQYHPGV